MLPPDRTAGSVRKSRVANHRGQFAKETAGDRADRWLTSERCDTVILVQNGPALEKLADDMMGDDEMAHLLKKADLAPDTLPPYFELLFRIEVGTNELAQRDANLELVASRACHWDPKFPL